LFREIFIGIISMRFGKPNSLHSETAAGQRKENVLNVPTTRIAREMGFIIGMGISMGLLFAIIH
jgi:hypothetical protein